MHNGAIYFSLVTLSYKSLLKITRTNRSRRTDDFERHFLRLSQGGRKKKEVVLRS